MQASIPQNELTNRGSRSQCSSDEDSFEILDSFGDEVNDQVLRLQSAECVEPAESSITIFSAMQTTTDSEILTTTASSLRTTAPSLRTTAHSQTTTAPSLTTALSHTITAPSEITTALSPTTLPPLNENSSMFISQESNLSGLSDGEIKQELQNFFRYNVELIEQLKWCNLKMKEQYEELNKLNEEMVEKEKLVENLKAGEVILKAKISALGFELEPLRRQANSKSSINQAKIIKELGLKLSESEKSKAEESIKYQNQIYDLSSQLNNAKEENEKINEQLVDVKKKLPTEIDLVNIENMKKQLKELAEEVLLKNTTLEEQTEQLNHVQVENEKIKEELADVKKKLPTEADAANIANMKEQLKELAEEVVLKNKMLKEKTELTDQLHEAISKLKIENEFIEILKTQVEVYQTDLNQERQEKEKLKSEKDKIAENSGHLQRCNQKLWEENDILKRNAFIHTVESCNQDAATSESPPFTFTCPICANRFSDYLSAHEHVEQCIRPISSDL